MAAYDLSAADVAGYLNIRAYYELMQQPIPDSMEAAFERFSEDRLLRRSDSGLYDITNLGALLFSRDLEKFPGPREFADMTKDERIRACYQHAGLRWVSNQQMTNETLRTRFGFGENQAAQASRIIADTLAAGSIKQYDPTNTSKRHVRYIPYWA